MMMRELDESWADLQRDLQTAIAEVNAREGVTKLGYAYTVRASYVLNAKNVPVVNVSLNRATGELAVKTVRDHGWHTVGQWTIAPNGGWQNNGGIRTAAELARELCDLAMRCDTEV
jgi:hypothetical protein